MTLFIMAVFWWHLLVSEWMSSLSLMMVEGWLTGWSLCDRLWSLPPLLFLFATPPPPSRWTFAYGDPDPPRKSRTKSHEIRCQKLLSRNTQRKCGRQPFGVMRIVWLHFTADGRINLPATRCGQAFPTTCRQIWLRSRITPSRHFTR